MCIHSFISCASIPSLHMHPFLHCMCIHSFTAYASISCTFACVSIPSLHVHLFLHCMCIHVIAHLHVHTCTCICVWNYFCSGWFPFSSSNSECLKCCEFVYCGVLSPLGPEVHVWPHTVPSNLLCTCTSVNGNPVREKVFVMLSLGRFSCVCMCKWCVLRPTGRDWSSLVHSCVHPDSFWLTILLERLNRLHCF